MLSHLREPVEAGSIVRRVREERGMSRASLSSATGVSARSLYALETGESDNFGLGNLIKVLGALGLSLCIDDDRANGGSPPRTPEASDEPPFTGAWEALPDVWRLSEGAS